MRFSRLRYTMSLRIRGLKAPRMDSSAPSRRPRKLNGLLILLAAIVGLSGCKTPDFIGKRYNNFTAYYNTLYNAERQFRSGYENLDRTSAKVDREEYLPLFVKTTGTSATREFEQTILKSADILRDHSESKWVDDALMLIGKSYFYQENYVGATQKFAEIIEQNTGLRDEAQFWLARSLMTSGAYVEALEVLTLAMAQEDVDAQWVAQDRLLLAEMAIRQELWETAAGHLAAGLEEIKDKELAGRASFLLGQVAETLGDYETAFSAYRGVRNYSAPYELDYAGRFSAVRVDGLFLNPDRALVEVRKLERDDKNLDKTAELRFLRARILQEYGGVDQAVAMYEELLYDPLALPPGASIGDLRGPIHYALGERYRDIDRDYLMAAAHFDTASVAIGSGTGTRTSNRPSAAKLQAKAPEAIRDAGQLKEGFSRYAFVWRDVARYDSLLFLGSLTPEEYDARIMELRRERAAELEEQRRLLAQRQREQAFRESASSSNLNIPNRGLPEGKVIPTMDDPTGTAGGFLFHEDPIRVQEGLMQFQNIWGNRPRVPNWRRSAALSSVDIEAAEEEMAQQAALLEEFAQDELPEIDDSAVPRDSMSQVKMEADRAIARYELGNILFLGMALPDSAATWYRTVIEEDSDEPVASRAQFALAEVQRALGDSLTAVRLYRDLLDRFPDSDFIPGVRDRLGIESDLTVITDSSAMATDALERTLAMRDVGSEGLVDSLLVVASDWIEYPEASRALFVISDLHLTAADGDSAAVFIPIQHSVHTDYMANIWPDMFKTQAEIDSLASAAAARADSMASALEAEADAETESEIVAADSLVAVEGADDSVALPDSTQTLVSPEQGSASPEKGALPEEGDQGIPADSSIVAAEPDEIGGEILADSVAVVDELPAEAGEGLQGAPADSLILPPSMDALSEPEEMSQAENMWRPVETWVQPDLTIEDVLKKVVSLESRTALGMRAQATLDAIIELRTPPPPPVDTLATDSLSIAGALTDSLEVALPSDSLALANDSSAVYITAEARNVLESDSSDDPSDRPQAALSDEAVMALVARSAARQDSLRAAQERRVPSAGRPGKLEEEEGVRSSSNLKPMLPNGQFDDEAVGYTFTFGSHPDLASAQSQYRDLSVLLEETGITLYMISNAGEEQLEYLVGWGIFMTRDERDGAEEEFSSILPEPRNILHLLAAE